MEESTNNQTVEMEIPTENPQQTTQPQVEAKSEELSTSNPHKHVYNTVFDEGALLCGDCLLNKRGTFRKPKSNTGRPCAYCERAVEIETKTNKYLNDCRGKNGGKPSIPFLEEIADMLNVDAETVMNWANKKKSKEDDSFEHPQFFDTIKSVKNYQKLQLLKRTLGRFSPAGAIFQLKANHGLIETEKQILAGSSSEPLQIEFTQEKQIPEGLEDK